MALSVIRRRPTLPGRFQPSTISVLRLNFCVRDGNRWVPQAIVTGNFGCFPHPQNRTGRSPSLLCLTSTASLLSSRHSHTISLGFGSGLWFRLPGFRSRFLPFSYSLLPFPYSLSLQDQALDLLVSPSSMRYRTSTDDLSTLSSSRGLTRSRDGNSLLWGGFTLRCLQRLSRPHFASLLCRWHDNSCTRGASIPVLSY